MVAYIIDDDEVSIFLTEQVLLLEDLVTEVFSFTTAETALNFLLTRLPTAPPQLILLDLNMPVLDGWGFLVALEPHQAALGGCLIYLLTSSLAPVDIARTTEYALVGGIIHKPIREDDVSAIKARMQASAANGLRC